MRKNEAAVIGVKNKAWGRSRNNGFDTGAARAGAIPYWHVRRDWNGMKGEGSTLEKIKSPEVMLSAFVSASSSL